MSTRPLAVLAVSLLACNVDANDVLADVFSGTVVSVSPSSGRIVVKARSKGTNRSFRIGKSVRVSLDGKRSFLSRVKPGLTVSVFAENGIATRLIVRTPKTGDDKPDRARPKPAPKKPATTRPAPRSTPPDRQSTPPRPATGTAVAWSQFRGPNRDNISADTGLLTTWPPDGPPAAWMGRTLGEGYSSVAVSGGKVFTMGNRGQNEYVIALDAATGEPAWATPNGNAFQNGTGNGPRGTPAVDGNRVYALGANGDLSCLDTATGRKLWSKNILREYGGRNIGWGISESVLIDGDKLICTPGGSRGTMVALDKNSGRQIWAAQVPGNPQASYASPVAIDVDGVRQYVNFTSKAVVGVRARDGQVLWGQRESANGTANCSSPLFFDGHVFTASGYGTGGALFRLRSQNGQTRSQVAYSTRDMINHHGGMVYLDGYIYGTDERTLKCLEARTGETKWQARSVGKGSITYADGHLYVRSEQGPVALVEANPREYVEKGRFNQPQRSGRSAWAHPAVADGKLFLRDMNNLLVYNVRGN